MKKILPILLVAVLALTGCQNKNPYAGKYTGTFTFVTDNVSKSGTMQFSTNPLTGDLLLYSVIPLTATSSSTYVSNSGALEYLTTLLEAMGNTNNIYNSVTERIQDVAITTEFTGSTVNAIVQYKIEILGTMDTYITIVKFTGTR